MLAKSPSSITRRSRNEWMNRTISQAGAPSVWPVMECCLATGVCADNPSAGYVDFGKFSPPASGGEFVEVHIKSNVISMVARLVEKSEPDVAELIRGLQLIRVNVIGLDEENRAEMEKRVKKIR